MVIASLQRWNVRLAKRFLSLLRLHLKLMYLGKPKEHAMIIRKPFCDRSASKEIDGLQMVGKEYSKNQAREDILF
jgi:hypothetical protein